MGRHAKYLSEEERKAARMENGGRAPQLSTILRLFDAVGYKLKPSLK